MHTAEARCEYYCCRHVHPYQPVAHAQATSTATSLSTTGHPHIPPHPKSRTPPHPESRTPPRPESITATPSSPPCHKKQTSLCSCTALLWIIHIQARGGPALSSKTLGTCRRTTVLACRNCHACMRASAGRCRRPCGRGCLRVFSSVRLLAPDPKLSQCRALKGVGHLGSAPGCTAVQCTEERMFVEKCYYRCDVDLKTLCLAFTLVTM